MRTTATKVKEILETELDNSIVEAYILGANELINSKLTNSGLSESLLEEIERWLTAHMIASTRERQTKKEEAGTAKVEYAGTYGLGLDSTSYGQTVISLDTTGKLADLRKRPILLKAIKS